MGRPNPFEMLDEMTPELMAWWRAYDRIEPIGVYGAHVTARVGSVQIEEGKRAKAMDAFLGKK